MTTGYQPNPALEWALRRLFAAIEVAPNWASSIREAAQRGRVVYVLRNLSFVDFLALDHMTKLHGLPEVGFANDLGLFLLEPLGRGWLSALRRRIQPVDDSAELARIVRAGSSAALFLRRPSSVLSGHRRGAEEGDSFLAALLNLQAQSATPILLVPQAFSWSRRPSSHEGSLADAVFGSQEWPGKMRTLAQFTANYRDVTLRSAAPFDLQAFQTEHADLPQPAQVRRLTYALLRRLERERRLVADTTEKPRDRLRENVLRSPRLQAVIREMAGPGDASASAVTGRARSLLGSLESAPNRASLHVMNGVFETTIARMYPHIEVDANGVTELRECAKRGVLVLLPTHRSHVDYILMTRVCLEGGLPIPRVAAGDNLNFFPLGAILRRGGAFFIRRKFAGDRLYAAVVDAYLRRLLRDGNCLEFYLEGGRSRTGKLIAPKLGLLSMVVDAALATTERKIYFCPVSIAYDRMVEADAIQREVSGGDKAKESVSGLGRAAQKVFGRYGTASVQFATPFTLEDIGHATHAPLTDVARRALIERLAYRTLREMNRVTAVTPGSLVAAALLTTSASELTHAELIASCTSIRNLLDQRGARLGAPLIRGGGSAHTALTQAIELFEASSYIERVPSGARSYWPFAIAWRQRSENDARQTDSYRIRINGRIGLDYAKNSLVHFFVEQALIATAFGATQALQLHELHTRAESLSDLFEYEFSFRNDANYNHVFEFTLNGMVKCGELERVGDTIQMTANAAVGFYRALLVTFVEGYQVAARSLRDLLRADLSEAELIRRALVLGNRMYATGAITRPEAVSKSILGCAFESFVAQGYLRLNENQFSLTDSYRSATTVATVEAKLTYFLTSTTNVQ
jgi:glycerol-3-phosphate O-acyltransferase